MIIYKKVKKCIAIKCLAIVVCLFAFACPIQGQVQGHAYIKEQIRHKGECRNVIITKSIGSLMLHGRNGWAGIGLPHELFSTLRKLTNEGMYIDDIQLTEEGCWIVLMGKNGFTWFDIPYSMELQIRKASDDGEVITTATFNDAGDWIVITSKNYIASNDEIARWLKAGTKKFGLLLSATITDDAMVAVFKGGYLFYGNVPLSLRTSLRGTPLHIQRVKMNGTAWFFADKDGYYQHSL
jgi:hypothetical protein